MDWKREAADKLRCYEAKRTSLERSAEEIRRLEDEMTSIRSATTDSTPVQGGSSTREDIMVNNIALREELRRARRIAYSGIKQVDGALSVLDEDERHVLDMMYIHRARGNAERLREELGLKDVRSVYKRNEKALYRFAIALYGVSET